MGRHVGALLERGLGCLEVGGWELHPASGSGALHAADNVALAMVRSLGEPRARNGRQLGGTPGPTSQHVQLLCREALHIGLTLGKGSADRGGRVKYMANVQMRGAGRVMPRFGAFRMRSGANLGRVRDHATRDGGRYGWG